jgi:hypothetical protein
METQIHIEMKVTQQEWLLLRELRKLKDQKIDQFTISKADDGLRIMIYDETIGHN